MLRISDAPGDCAGPCTQSPPKLLLGADVSEDTGPPSVRTAWLFSIWASSRSDPHLALASKHVLAVTSHLGEGISGTAHGCPRLEVDVEAQLPWVIKVTQCQSFPPHCILLHNQHLFLEIILRMLLVLRWWTELNSNTNACGTWLEMTIYEYPWTNNFWCLSYRHFRAFSVLYW